VVESKVYHFLKPISIIRVFFIKQVALKDTTKGAALFIGLPNIKLCVLESFQGIKLLILFFTGVLRHLSCMNKI